MASAAKVTQGSLGSDFRDTENTVASSFCFVCV